MQFKKQKLADLNLCYAIGRFKGKDQDSFLVATEKQGPCLRFDLEGNLIEEVWAGPGGVMTITQVPKRDDQFLATQEFYSPNCGGEDARIVSATRDDSGTWQVRTLTDLPYVHRFGILKAKDGSYHLIACTIKSACEYKEDWRTPGKVYVAELGENLEQYDKDNQLELSVLLDDQLKNHGFYLSKEQDYCLIATAKAVYRITPPENSLANWQVETLIEKSVSDICLADFDGDGKDELLTLAEFHGDELSVYHLDDADKYSQLVYRHPEKLPFLHAIWSCELDGKEVAVIGHRKGDRDLFIVSYDDQQKDYKITLIDHDFGPTNTYVYQDKGVDKIVATNRETNEVALYTVIK